MELNKKISIKNNDEVKPNSISKEIEKDMKKVEYLRRFEKQVHPEFWAKDGTGVDEIIKKTGDEIIEKLKSQELTYVDAYITLEYVYRKLKFNSEYTHL